LDTRKEGWMEDERMRGKARFSIRFRKI